MGKSASELSQELDQTRADASDKIEQIEQRVTDTADSVKQQVAETTDSVKQSLDWRYQVETRPLVALGVAFMGGVMVGSVTGGNDHDRPSRSTSYGYEISNDRYARSTSNGHESQGGVSGAISHAVRASGAEEALTSAAAAMVATAGKQLKDSLDKQYPGFSERYEQSKAAGGGLGARVKAATEESADEDTTPTDSRSMYATPSSRA